MQLSSPVPKPMWSSGTGDARRRRWLGEGGSAVRRGSSRRSAYGSMLRTAALWTLAPGAVASGAWGALHGAGAGVSCALGVLVVAALFASAMWALRLVLRGAPHLAQAGAFAVFFLQMYVGLMLAAAGRTVAWIQPFPLAAGALGATVLWQAGLVAGFATARRPVFSPDDVGVSNAGKRGPGAPTHGAPKQQEGGR